MQPSRIHSGTSERRKTTIPSHVLPLRPLLQPIDPRQLLRDRERRVLLRDLSRRGGAPARQLRPRPVAERRGEVGEPQERRLQHLVRDSAGTSRRRGPGEELHPRQRERVQVHGGEVALHPEPAGGFGERFRERGAAGAAVHEAAGPGDCRQVR